MSLFGVYRLCRFLKCYRFVSSNVEALLLFVLVSFVFKVLFILQDFYKKLELVCSAKRSLISHQNFHPFLVRKLS